MEGLKVNQTLHEKSYLIKRFYLQTYNQTKNKPELLAILFQSLLMLSNSL